MNHEFEKYLKEQTGLPNEDVLAISERAISRSLRRNEMVLQEGEVCRHKVFVVQGLLHTFITGAGGNESILQFSPEMTWTLDVESYDKAIPTAVNISATEPTEVLLWRKEDFQELLSGFPLFKKFSEQLISRNIYYSRQRMAIMLNATPEEKYEDFTKNFPHLLSRLPLRMIASYLGISLKTLTRIRHAQLQREMK